jgi:hypothetical protein
VLKLSEGERSEQHGRVPSPLPGDRSRAQARAPCPSDPEDLVDIKGIVLGAVTLRQGSSPQQLKFQNPSCSEPKRCAAANLSVADPPRVWNMD